MVGKHGPLAGILILAALLYGYGLDWGIASLKDFRLDGRRVSFAAASFHPDSNALERAAASLDYSVYPHIVRDGKTFLFSSYGTVFIYVYWGSVHIAGAVFGFEPFGEAAADSDATRMVGRVVSALLGLMTVWVTYLVGSLSFGYTTGLLAASLLCLMPMMIQASHMATVDGALALGTVWMCYHAMAILEDKRLRSYILCGVASGITVAIKLNAVLLLAAPVLAHFCVSWRASGETHLLGRLWRPLAGKGLWVFLGCMVGVYGVLTPAAFLRFEDYFLTEFYGNIFHVLWLNLTGVEVDGIAHLQRGSLYLEGVPTYLYHLTDVFPAGLGWPLMMLIAAGIFYSVFQRSPQAIVLTGTVMIYFLIVGRFWDKPIRYFVPLGPLFSLLSAWAVIEALKLQRKVQRYFSVGFATVLVLASLIYGVAFAQIYVAVDPRVEAARWTEVNVATDSPLLLERGHNNLSTLISPERNLQIMDLEQEMYNTPNRRLAERGDYVACIEGAYLSNSRYLVISDDRMAMAATQPAAKRYYGDLLKGKLGYTPVQRFTARPKLFGWRFDDSATDLNGRRYDHPATFVFRRTGEASLYEEYPDLKAYRLKSYEDCLNVFNWAVRVRDLTLFKYVLPRELKASLDESSQMKLLEQFIRNPDMSKSVNQPGAFIEEDGRWKVNLRIDG